MFPGPWVLGEAADCVNIDGDRFGWCQRRIPRPVLSLARLMMKGLRRCLFRGVGPGTYPGRSLIRRAQRAGNTNRLKEGDLGGYFGRSGRQNRVSVGTVRNVSCW